MDRRIFTFTILAISLVIVWTLLGNWLNPPQEKPQPDPVVAQAEPEPQEQVKEKDVPAPDEQEAAKKDVEEAQEKVADEARKQALAAAGPERDIHLGGNGYKLSVVFSSRGGVRSIVLNDHQQATRTDGKPVYQDKEKKVPEPLRLLDDEDDPLKRSFNLKIAGKEVIWKVVGQPTAERLVFEGKLPEQDIRITKTLTLQPGWYHIGMDLKFERLEGGDGEPLVYLMSGPYGLPIEGEYWRNMWYRRVVIGTVDVNDIRNSRRIVNEPYAVRNEEYLSPELEGANADEVFQYAGVGNQFFAAVAVVDSAPGEHPPAYIARVASDYVGDDVNFRPGRDNMQGHVSTHLTSKPVSLAPNESVEHRYLLYAGPAKVKLLGYEEGVEEGLAARYEEDLRMYTLTDYTEFPNGPWQAIGWTSLIVFFTNLMHTLLQWFHSWVGIYGIAIILLTFLVRSLMFPISRKQTLAAKKMQDKMKEMRPELDVINKKHKDDPAERMRAQQVIFKKHGYSPFGMMGGCLVMLLQMPVFMGLYFALGESVNLRLASFLWIENLAAPDMLFWWGDNFITSFLRLGPYFNLMPLLSVGMMFLHQKLVAPPPADEQQAMQMKIMNFMMIFMGFMFYWVASGLCLYFTVSSGWALIERKILSKKKLELTKKNESESEKRPGSPSRNGQAAPKKGLMASVRELWTTLQEKADKR